MHRPSIPGIRIIRCFFPLDNGDVIDAAVGGNEARWINHSCDPNCETFEEGDRIFVHALRGLQPGDELFYDYKMIPSERRDQQVGERVRLFLPNGEMPQDNARAEKRKKEELGSQNRFIRASRVASREAFKLLRDKPASKGAQRAGVCRTNERCRRGKCRG